MTASSEPVSAAPTTWEYVTVPLITHATKQILDQWGADGWELVQVVPGPSGTDNHDAAPAVRYLPAAGAASSLRLMRVSAPGGFSGAPC